MRQSHWFSIQRENEFKSSDIGLNSSTPTPQNTALAAFTLCANLSSTSSSKSEREKWYKNNMEALWLEKDVN